MIEIIKISPENILIPIFLEIIPQPALSDQCNLSNPPRHEFIISLSGNAKNIGSDI
jgi:hypothetical protein